MATQEKKTVSVRSTRPKSYMFEVKSFTTISKCVEMQNNVKCFESPDFESGGHKWKLCVYPNGDEKQAVDDHISLYLVSTGDKIDSNGSEINVLFTMFLYDHIRDNYLTIQDTEVKRFSRFQKEFGFAQLISLKNFQEARNGYLMNDCCVFGVDIFVLSPVVKFGSLSMVKLLKGGTFSWKFDRFQSLSNDEYYSEAFVVHGHEWKLKIHPRGTASGANTHLSIFLVAQNLNFAGNDKIYAEVVLRVRDHNQSVQHEVELFCCFSKSVTSGGIESFVCRNRLRNMLNFTNGNRVTFEVEILSISDGTDMTYINKPKKQGLQW